MNLAAFAPWAAGFLFVFMFILVITEKFERHVVTLACGAAVLVIVFGICMHSWQAAWWTLNIQSIFTLDFWYSATESAESSSGINWATILFIAGMMIMVEGMASAGFFRWLCLRFAKLVKYRATRIFLAFMIMSAILAMFIDSITVILFLAAVTVELAQLLKFDPVSVILAEIFCANLGGSATMCGDPPNIIIGTALGYSFSDFVSNTGVIAGISLVCVVIYFWLYFAKKLKKSETYLESIESFPDPHEAILDRARFIQSTFIFGLAVVLLVSHANTHLTVAFIGTFIALLTLVCAGGQAMDLLRKVDYRTLLFFVGLFVVVRGLEETGVLEIVAGLIADWSNGSLYLMVAIILWLSALASAVVDNIPFAATMIPIIRTLAQSQSVPLATLAWTLSMGTDIGGSATPIGASANVVGTAVAMKAGYPISWGKYCKYCAGYSAGCYHFYDLHFCALRVKGREIMIVTISREFGSGGQDIARALAAHYHVPLYDENMLSEIGIHESYDIDQLNQYDEAPRWMIRSRTVRGLTNSNIDNIAMKDFDFLRERARVGKSFIVLGHCGESILKEYGPVSIFVNADMELRIERTMQKFGLDEKEARALIKKTDRNRKTYHNYYCDNKWGDSRYYDLCIESSTLGVDETIDFLIDFIDRCIKAKEKS